MFSSQSQHQYATNCANRKLNRPDDTIASDATRACCQPYVVTAQSQIVKKSSAFRRASGRLRRHLRHARCPLALHRSCRSTFLQQPTPRRTATSRGLRTPAVGFDDQREARQVWFKQPNDRSSLTLYLMRTKSSPRQRGCACLPIAHLLVPPLRPESHISARDVAQGLQSHRYRS